ncbi:MAG: hypothetical protein ACM36C_00345, partial [Acidobacteriota bacterium]
MTDRSSAARSNLNGCRRVADGQGTFARLARIAGRVSMVLALGAAVASSAWAAPALKGRAVWAHPADAGTTQQSVRAFVEQLDRAHVNTVIMEVKTAAGLYWPSERFAEAV